MLMKDPMVILYDERKSINTFWCPYFLQEYDYDSEKEYHGSLIMGT